MKNKFRFISLIAMLFLVGGNVIAQRNQLPTQDKGVSIKSIFEDKNAPVFIPKEVGLEKVIAKINKIGKSKASLETYEKKQYIKVVTQEKDAVATNVYPVDNSNPMGYIISNSGSLACYNAGCTSCTVIGYGGTLSCSCNYSGSGTQDPNNPLRECLKRSAYPFATYLAEVNPNIKNLAVAFAADGTTLTAGSVKDITTSLAAEMPRVKVDKVEVIKDQKDRYLSVAIKSQGYVGHVTLLRKIAVTPAGIYAYAASASMSWRMVHCGGTCNGADCRSVSPSYSSGMFSCACIQHTCEIWYGFLAPGWQTQ